MCVKWSLLLMYHLLLNHTLKVGICFQLLVLINDSKMHVFDHKYLHIYFFISFK